MSLQNKSLLSTINTGFNDTESVKEPQQVPLQTPVVSEPKPIIKCACSIIKDPVIEELNNLGNCTGSIIPGHDKEESIKGTVDSGFGSENELIIECLPPKVVSYLVKENYLGEFKTKLDKQLARDNLDVYSRTEVTNIIQNSYLNISKDFVTHIHLNTVILGLSFVDSTLKSLVDYQIPEILFKL